ncbi:Nmdar1 [Symbiodinium natans]|uniref:Nmdar1 protein n=1 Tax=Symbiodinium natans TaxID=878477 RepID=A0A812JED4_9DINO|nr:Nmdar1 [Symbiodinium natans]
MLALAVRLAMFAQLAHAVAGSVWRNDFCPEFEKVQAGTLQIEKALVGKHLTFVVPTFDMTDPTSSHWNDGQPVGPPENDMDITHKVHGYHASVLKAVSKVANFTYTIRLNTVPGASTTTWLLQQSPNYDAVLGSWSDSLVRREAGFLQPYPLVTKDLKMIVQRKIDSPSVWSVMFTFLKPFSTSLWLLLFVCSLVTAAFMWFFETSRVSIEEGGEVEVSDGSEGALKSVWLSGLQFTGGGGYTPVTAWGRLLLLSWSFLIMVVGAAYTANLATFLIVHQTASTSLSSFEEAKQQNAKVCARMEWSIGEFLREIAEGKVRFVDVSPKHADGIREFLDDGKCEAYVSYQDIGKLYLNEKAFNDACKYDFVGPSIKPLTGGWPISIIQHGCPQLLLTSLSVALKYLDKEGTVKRIWSDFASSRADMDQSCNVPEVSDSASMGVYDMAGVLSLHALCLILALAFWAFCKTQPFRESMDERTAFKACWTEGDEESVSQSADETKVTQNEVDKACDEAMQALQRWRQVRQSYQDA